MFVVLLKFFKTDRMHGYIKSNSGQSVEKRKKAITWQVLILILHCANEEKHHLLSLPLQQRLRKANTECNRENNPKRCSSTPRNVHPISGLFDTAQ